MIGARVNGSLVGNDYVIQNGDKIEIITGSENKGPSRDWLTFVKSPQAKNKINQWFRHEEKEENIVRGKELLAAYCKPRGFDYAELAKTPYTDYVVRKYGFNDWNAVLAAIGHGGLKEGQIFNKMMELYERNNKKSMTNEEVLKSVAETQAKKPKPVDIKGGIVVEGTDDVAVRFGKCCNPLPGDEIVGFVTRGRGVSIHRVDCVNMRCLSEEEKPRMIAASWNEAALKEHSGEKYNSTITVFATNRQGLLVDITKIFSERNISISSLTTATSKKEVATVQISFEVKSKEELASLIEKIRQVESVQDIQRTTN